MNLIDMRAHRAIDAAEQQAEARRMADRKALSFELRSEPEFDKDTLRVIIAHWLREVMSRTEAGNEVDRVLDIIVDQPPPAVVEHIMRSDQWVRGGYWLAEIKLASAAYVLYAQRVTFLVPRLMSVHDVIRMLENGRQAFLNAAKELRLLEAGKTHFLADKPPVLPS